MFGLILGTFCLFALLATIRRHRYGYRYAYGSPGFYGGWYGPPPFLLHGRYHAFDDGPHRPGTCGHERHGRHGSMRALFERLETTPGQEKVIAQALATFLEHLHGARDELKTARKSLATAIGGDAIDGAALDASLTQHKQLTERLAQELTQALLTVHEALDGSQRKELAELIAHEPLRGLRGFGRI